VPTWKEQGVDSVVENWRALIGPPGLDAAQIAYWEKSFQLAVRSEAWKKELEANFWADDFRSSRDTRAMLNREYDELKQAMTDLGLVK
jgi:putative tricarboxylic transport membrane protein